MEYVRETPVTQGENSAVSTPILQPFTSSEEKTPEKVSLQEVSNNFLLFFFS